MPEADSRVRSARLVVLAVYTALAIAWSFIVPLGGGIDEPRHLRYVQIVAEEHRLPTVAEKGEAISHHPPLHYLLAAPVWLSTRALGQEVGWRALRMLSILMGGLTIWVMFAMLRRIVPERPWLAVSGMAALALLPHFQLIAIFLSNDISVTLACTVMFYLVVRALNEPRRAVLFSALAGLAGGLAVLSKMNGLTAVPVAFVAVIAAAWVPVSDGDEPLLPRSSRALRNAVAFIVPFALTGLAYIGHYLLTWGRLDSDPAWPDYSWPVHTFVGRLIRAVEGLYRSTWAQMGWIPGPHSTPPLGPSSLWPRPNLEAPIFALTLPIAAIALIGTSILIVRWLRRPETRDRGLAGLMIVGAWLLAYAALVHNAIYINPGRFEGSRYALQVVAATVGMMAIGPMVLPKRWTRVCWIATIVLLLAMNIISCWEMYAYLIPTFAP